ncbi:HD-GYP domain-containing protein [Mesobacillus zeae]|uniref:HD-GYP domain-containing protein n=1 Tax=Mesobacillus zeae TaxID=1917180 RepID=UPI0030093ABD
MNKPQTTQTLRVVGMLLDHCLSSYQHSLRVGDALYQFARYLEMPKLEDIYLLGLTHDIGKLKIPNHLLNKKTPLTSQEFESIKLHTEYGQKILESFDGLPSEYPTIIRFHHENYDGTGYYGLKDKAIPQVSRMLRIIDSYDTMLNGRVYKAGKTQQEVIEEIYSLSGKYYDPYLTSEFKKFLNKRYHVCLNTGA